MDNPIERRILWFEDEAMHVDLEAYARARGLQLAEAEVEVRQMFGALLPGIPVKVS